MYDKEMIQGLCRRVSVAQEHLHREMLSPVEQMRAKFKKRRKEAGDREDSTMAKLARFASSIRDTKKRAATDNEKEQLQVEHHPLEKTTRAQVYLPLQRSSVHAK